MPRAREAARGDAQAHAQAYAQAYARAYAQASNSNDAEVEDEVVVGEPPCSPPMHGTAPTRSEIARRMAEAKAAADECRRRAGAAEG